MKNLMIGVLLSTAAMSVPASAATLFVNYTGNSFAGTFNIESDPTVKTSDRLGIEAFISNGTGYFLNRNTTFFWSREGGGGLSGFAGPQLYTGSASSPTIITGTFGPTLNGKITISDVASLVPESSTWALMLVGFGMIGAATRYRRKGVKVRYV